jgi:hypothetical protein
MKEIKEKFWNVPASIIRHAVHRHKLILHVGRRSVKGGTS